MMAPEGHLARHRELVESALREALPPEGRRPARLTAALRHGVLAGGKRLRPLLCLAAAEAAGGEARDALPAAVAVELLHNYTLVHDDLPCMDNDLTRRGRPTVHALFGAGMGVLAGDALQALAFEVLARAMRRRPALATRLTAELAAAAGPAGVAGGQAEDLDAAGAAAVDEETVAFVHQHKTACLFRAALRMGALAAGGGTATVDRLGEYGNHLGLAFQIADDLRDAGDPAKAGELSCLRVWTPGEARRRASAHLDAALAALRRLPPLAAAGPLRPLRLLAARLRRQAAPRTKEPAP
jgi:geranylgeranyl pyrophosphate synthase